MYRNGCKTRSTYFMKKQILLLLCLTVSSLITFAQKKQDITFGVKAGLTSSNVKGDAMQSLQSILDFTDGMITTESRTGFYGGVDVNIPLSKNFSFSPGVMYAQKGVSMKGELGLKGVEFLGINAGAELQNDYIDIPMLLKANVEGLEIFAGPQFSYLMNSKLKTQAGLLGVNLLNKSFDVSDQFNKWDAGVTGGIGYTFKNGLSLSASYDHGLSKLDNGKSVNAYNRSFKVGAAFKF